MVNDGGTPSTQDDKTVKIKPEKLNKELMAIIREVIPQDRARVDIRPELTLDALGIDSLGKATMAFRLEEKYGINLADYTTEIAKIRTISDVLDLATRAVAAT